MDILNKQIKYIPSFAYFKIFYVIFCSYNVTF